MLQTFNMCNSLKIKKSSLTLVLAVLMTSVAHANDAVILLNQMNNALHTLEYQGNLVYLKDGEVSNLSIRHTIENGAEKEVIASLDEGGDEYIKESNAFSLSGLPKITSKMQQVYSFDLGGMGKVAGRPCRIVLARPKDRKRYLQKYCIDLDRSVLLKYSLIDQHHKPVERFMFTDFEVISENEAAAEKVEQDDSVIIDESIAKAQKKPMSTPQVASKQMQTMNTMASTLTSTMPNDTASKMESSADTLKMKVSGDSISGYDNYSEWFFDPLPKGFSIISADKVRNPQGEDEQIIISDGLSSVSVFISTDNTNVEKRIKPIQSGALNILSKVHEGHAVTLVGEVPEATLHDIFKSIRRATIKE